jgi:hypothetical protein
MEMFKRKDWSTMCGTEKEVVPGNVPEPIENEFIISVYDDD